MASYRHRRSPRTSLAIAAPRRLGFLDYEEEIEREWRQGERPEVIAAVYGTLAREVRRLSRERGWPPQPAPRAPPGPGVPSAKRLSLSLMGHEDDIHRLWLCGVPVGEIAARFSSHGPAIYALARVRGWPRRTLDTEKARRLWQEGVATEEIARLCCVPYEDIRRLAATCDWPSRPLKRRVDEEAALMMWKKGNTMTTIAAHFQVTVSAISKLAAKNGWPERRRYGLIQEYSSGRTRRHAPTELGDPGDAPKDIGSQR